jgi:hypothetical protein
VILDLENVTESLREAPQIQNMCRRVVPYIQYFFFYRPEFKSVYSELEQLISDKLKRMKFYSVKELQNVYRCLHDHSIQVVVSNKSCLDLNETSTTWKYYVRADLLENEKETIKGN